MTTSSRPLAGDPGTAPWQQLNPEAAASLAVDDVPPRFHAAPRSPEEVAPVLRQAQAAGFAVLPQGGGTHCVLGNPPRRADLALSLGAISGIVEYRPHDLVAVALAGTPLALLQEEFAQHGQWLALDPPCTPESTLGGVLATNASGPHRLRYGTARDLVLGMQVAYADGTLARSGAKVVKSVAGYDLHKMHVGALGTLGVIIEVAVRLHPLPMSRRAMLCPVPDAGTATQVVGALLRRPLALGAIEYLDAAAAHRLATRTAISLPERDMLLVFCEGHARAVVRQSDEVSQAARHLGIGAEVLIDGDPVAALSHAVAQLRTARTTADTVLKLTVPPGSTLLALEELSGLLRAAIAGPDARAPGQNGRVRSGGASGGTEPSRSPVAIELHAHAGSGVVYAVALLPEASVAPLVTQARAAAQAWRGHLVVARCPARAKRELDVWGPVSAPGLVRGLKAALDPHNTLNPGRFAEGL